MPSIIEFFKANKLNYTASGTQNECGGFYAAFENDKHFCSTYLPPNYWQVTFARSVTITGYIISAPQSVDWYTTQWKVSYSVDGSSFTDVQTYSKSLKGNTEKFLLPYQINCKIFKITGIENSVGYSDLSFNSFDCFGSVSLKRTRNQCSCNFYFYKRRLTISFLLTLFPSFLT